MASTVKKTNEPLFHIVKRANIEPWKVWAIRILSGLAALLVCGIVATIFTKDFGGFYSKLFQGVFGTEKRIWDLLYGISILLCIALAITPAFKMKFWNIGAEGQVLIAGLASYMTYFYLKDTALPGPVIVLLMAIFAIIAGAIWGVIPAIFKANWNTNETLFTLMMNYIAIGLIKLFTSIVAKDGSGTLKLIKDAGRLVTIGNYKYLLIVIIVAVITAIIAIYLKYSKHGYEISVVGESENTARYIGINVKKIIIRTMFLSGALCGVAGFLIVSGASYNINGSTVGGQGFTAILVSWLAHFNPIGMVLTAFLVIFFQQGSSFVNSQFQLGSDSFRAIIVGIFFFFIIGCEFFVNYQIKLRHDVQKKINKKLVALKLKKPTDPVVPKPVPVTESTTVDTSANETAEKVTDSDKKEEVK